MCNVQWSIICEVHFSISFSTLKMHSSGCQKKVTMSFLKAAEPYECKGVKFDLKRIECAFS